MTLMLTTAERRSAEPIVKDAGQPRATDGGDHRGC